MIDRHDEAAKKLRERLEDGWRYGPIDGVDPHDGSVQARVENILAKALRAEAARSAEEVKKLRAWANQFPHVVYATRDTDGVHVPIAAFATKARAEQFAALGRSQTPGPIGPTIRVVDVTNPAENATVKKADLPQPPTEEGEAMNSEQIKAWLGGMVLDCHEEAPHAINYILALEAERDAWREMRKTGKKGRRERLASCQAAMARVDEFKPPAVRGEGEKA